MAIAGLHAKSRNLPSLDSEIFRLRLRALKHCHQISRRTWRPRASESESENSGITNASFCFQITNLESDDICLVTTAVLMVVFGKLSGEVYGNIRPYLEFAHDFLRHERVAQYNVRLSTTPFYLFLYNLVSYNQLLALVADTSLTSTSCGVYDGSVLADAFHQTRPNFPALLCRISDNVQQFSSFDIDYWDGNLDFLPSFSMKRKTAEHVGDADIYVTKEFTFVTADGGNDAKKDEKFIIGEIYRISSRIHFFKQLRDRDGLSDTPTTLAFPPFMAHKQIKKYSKRAIDLFRLLSDHSQFNTAILLPLGIIAPELTSKRDQTFVIEKLKMLERTQCFDVFRIFSQDLQDTWARVHASQSALLADFSERPVRLLG
ncbi:uncharacterized protein Z520_09418 [Fonsecaea multimorphosa CBS 102226]|uniref:Uncharacterized protein n=1 Tax=Fonsecaea multimorphosa CBS 102226 TaxID=1442371 RepID=A0A0D2KDD3_9EURO|nr:uncharacterized protein Z520_09418 [Fonsecaea multimorphosa CBS 102226]KIX94728.1 hypothetical protein Z520_09418 [Fonsecaea multimorphosa CBS 102226]OAL20502.1 hypothetical protein AYO22_08803 [Fonsecaea multimorphosa]